MSASEQDQEIAKRIAERFPENKVEVPSKNRIDVDVSVQTLTTLATYLRDIEGFDHVTSVAGTDYPDKNLMTIIYHLSTYAKPENRRLILSVSASLPRQDLTVPSLVSIWPSAENHERETHEMLGITFQGHPNSNLLLLPEDWADIPPLRKDFKLRGR